MVPSSIFCPVCTSLIFSGAGHGGPDTAEHISAILPAALLAHPAENHASIFQETDNAMIKKFTSDHSIFRSKSKHWADHAKVVKSGCTALILDLDINTLLVSYANAGDCRAVISTANNSTPEIFLQQTDDLNAKTPSEQRRLALEHPGEDLLVVSGRLFGRLMSTRGYIFLAQLFQLPQLIF